MSILFSSYVPQNLMESHRILPVSEILSYGIFTFFAIYCECQLFFIFWHDHINRKHIVCFDNWNFCYKAPFPLAKSFSNAYLNFP